ncbi:MAG: D-glycero-alpha-D-manno-heptose-1,7-bisphosphate 7-phosphatase [Salibacteraceae bacterium]
MLPIEIDNSWTLFLDRDGVINQRLENDYVKTWNEFEFLRGVMEALAVAKGLFKTIVIVTNQQGIGKGIMTESDLKDIHTRMVKAIESSGGRIDKVYHCPELATANPDCRKPNVGMAMSAKQDFPEIDFKRSLMVGDSPSDMEFAQRLEMHGAYIGNDARFDCYNSLIHVMQGITSK